MLEFITQDTKLCPYCKNELTGSNYLMIPPYDYWKECKICNKRFEIAYFTQAEFKKAQTGDVITLDNDIQWKKNATCEINAQVQKE